MAPNCGRGTRNLYCSGRSFGSRGSKSSTLASTPPASVAPTLCAKTPSRASNESASRVGVCNGKKAEGKSREVGRVHRSPPQYHAPAHQRDKRATQPISHALETQPYVADDRLAGRKSICQLR